MQPKVLEFSFQKYAILSKYGVFCDKQTSENLKVTQSEDKTEQKLSIQLSMVWLDAYFCNSIFYNLIFIQI